MTKPDLTSAAPKRIYLDIGDQFALERVTSGSLRWDLLDGVTWSEDNATSHGIPYVRADLVPTPAASGAALLTDDAEHTARTSASYQYAERADPAHDKFNAARVAFLKGADWQKSWAALASPQVAPATVQVPAETQIYALCERAFEEWQLSPGCFPSYEMRLARLIFGSLATPVQVAPAPEPEAWLMTRPSGTKWAAVLDESGRRAHELDGCTVRPLFLATPVQVAPTLTRQQIDAAQEAADHKHGVHTWGEAPGSWRETFANEIARAVAAPVQVASTKRQPTDDDEMTLIESQIDGLLEGEGAGEDHANVKSWIAGAGLRESLVCRVHRAISCFERDHLSKPEAAPVAPQDDARDAAEAIDAELPAYPTGDVIGPCVCGSWPGGPCLKCPAAKPTEPTLPTQGEQSHD